MRPFFAQFGKFGAPYTPKLGTQIIGKFWSICPCRLTAAKLDICDIGNRGRFSLKRHSYELINVTNQLSGLH